MGSKQDSKKPEKSSRPATSPGHRSCTRGPGAEAQAQTLDIMGGLLDASVGASMAAYALRAARAFPGRALSLDKP